jgi:asparagine synthase (glutamine-hydrolysing)
VKGLKRLAPAVFSKVAGSSVFLSTEADGMLPYSPVPLLPPEGFDPLNRALFRDFHHGILPRILKNFDVMSMAHGVEVRMPLLDYRLVSFSFSLPAASKVGSGMTKRILREAMGGLLPDEVRLRKTKVGFNSPMSSWLKSHLGDWVEETLASGTPLAPVVDVPRMRDWFRSRRRSETPFGWDEAAQFWAYVSAIRLTQLSV